MKTIKLTEAERNHLTQALNKFIIEAAKPENILSFEVAEKSISFSLELRTKIRANDKSFLEKIINFFISK